MSEPTKDETSDHDGTPPDVPEGTETPEDASRRKFREALDRKKYGHRGQGLAHNPAAQHPHTAPAKPQKTFRRKSGGGG